MKSLIQGRSTVLTCLATLMALAIPLGRLLADDAVSPGVTALAHLQNDEVAEALDALGAAVDQQPLLGEEDEADLSPAAGGLFRALSQLSTDEQYDLLHAWSLPDESRQSVRMLTAPVPQHAPPVEFARLLGERPRETVFPIAQVGGVRGLFCSGWMLVQAADDIGRLSRLTTELEQLHAKSVPGAELLLLLARAADARSDLDPLAEALQSRITRFEEATAVPAEATAMLDSGTLALAAAALEQEPLRPAAEDLLRVLLESTYGKPLSRLRQFLRVAHATAVQRHRGESGPEILYSNRLKYWVPVSGMTSRQHDAGGVDAMWLVHEDHILHLSGTGNDVLFFRYPLTGEFTFTCETQEGGAMGTDGGLVYGGLQFEALGSTGQLTVADADFAHPTTRPCPFVRHEERPTFNRVSIRSTDEGARFLANLHPMWHDTDAALASPWLGLRSFGDRRPVFRNFKLTGEPVIPREVHLTREDSGLRGWRSRFLGQTQPPFATDADTSVETPSETVDWTIEAGVIQSRRQDTPPPGDSQSLLCYQRPLLEGESISYEFRYAPGELAVHPALGRLAFLIEPDGIRIHWITDGQREWTGLPSDNATLEPLNRRGPARLPLSTDEWNRLSIARSGGRITLTLNGEPVYERPIDYGGDLLFGLYHDRAQSGVRVRNVVMTGEWPATLPEEFLQNPAAVAVVPAEPADRQVTLRQIGEQWIAGNVRSVREHAALLAPQARFAFLLEWVFPGANHLDLRVGGAFTQAAPSPLAVPWSKETGTGARGGEVVSPVFDLLDVAVALGRLDELQLQIEGIDAPASADQQRALQALTALVAIERGNRDVAETAVSRLHTLTSQTVPATLQDQWPETLVIARLMKHPQSISLVADLLLQMYVTRTSHLLPADCEQWHTHIGAWTTRYRNAAENRTSTPIDQLQEGNWVPATRQRYLSRGPGNAPAIWAHSGNELVHLSGHQEEFLLYRSPLRGEFEFECDIIANQTQVLTAGRFCGPTGNGKEIYLGSFRRGSDRNQPIEPPFARVDPWMRYRAVFRDGHCKIFVGGQQVHEFPLPEHHAPWVGIRSWWRNNAGLRDARISGDPMVPAEVVLSALEDLTGWLPYFDDTIGFEGARWQFSPDPEDGHQIVGKRIAELAGTATESLLRYIRPLAEDGSVDYEFFYEPGTAITHPALDRLVFLLEPEGVRLHWITDGREDTTDVSPENALDVPAQRRGPADLPLREGTWNRLQVAITGRTVTLTLNGKLVYERELAPTNQRTFGLFHYADTEVRVRNVVLRGDWPREIPPVSQQPLADPLVAELNAGREQLEDVFEDDFADGLEPRYFELHNRDAQAVRPIPGIGLLMEITSPGDWTQATILPRFELHGDYDVELEFAQGHFGDAKNDGRAMLMVVVPGTISEQARIYRGRNQNQREAAIGQRVLTHPDGSHQYNGITVHHYSRSGRLRLARRGETVYFLLADDDSSQFRRIGQEQVSDAPTGEKGIQLMATANLGGRTRVIFKNVTLRADRLTLAPTPQDVSLRPLFVMAPDGSNLQQVTLPLEGFTNLGSPEWSPDSRRIALDMSRGSTTTSHVVVINSDGSDPQDLGPGCMPSFSADAAKIVFSQPGQGIVTMNADGTDRQVLDRGGWGAQWSPDGRWIAYGRSGNIVIVSPETGQSREILVGENARRYNYVYWNPGWSRDSRSIAFKGRNRQTDRNEVALAWIDAPEKFRVLYDGEDSVQPDFTFSPGNDKLLFAKQSNAHRGPALFVVDSAGGQPPQLLPGHPPDIRIYNCAWSPDGKHIAFSSQLPPEQLEWPLGATPPRTENSLSTESLD